MVLVALDEIQGYYSISICLLGLPEYISVYNYCDVHVPTTVCCCPNYMLLSFETRGKSFACFIG